MIISGDISKINFGGDTVKKTKSHKASIRRSGIRMQILWTVAGEDQRFIHIRNWLTGEHRVIRK